MRAPGSKAACRPRIVDFSSHLSGPIASYLLREIGADVIKVEPPGHGDGLRPLKPDIAGTGKYHAGVNAGARSLSLSPRSPHWAAVVDACAQWADAFIVGGRPEAARRRGLDFATLNRRFPRLVYCAISGYGDTGPWAGYAAHGLNPDAMTGMVPLVWQDGMPAAAAGYASAGTPLAGLFAALGILSALYKRELGEPAPYVTVSLWGAAMWWNWRELNLLANNGERRADYSTLGSRYSMYPTYDDRAILVCPIEKDFWKRFCTALGLPAEMAARGRWGEAHVDYGYDEERPLIAARTKQQTLAHWISAFEKADIPFAPVLTAMEALTSDHARANQVMRGIDVAGRAATVMASPVRLGDAAGAAIAPVPMASPPDLGGDTASILDDLGLSGLKADLAQKK